MLGRAPPSALWSRFLNRLIWSIGFALPFIPTALELTIPFVSVGFIFWVVSVIHVFKNLKVEFEQLNLGSPLSIIPILIQWRRLEKWDRRPLLDELWLYNGASSSSEIRF